MHRRAAVILLNLLSASRLLLAIAFVLVPDTAVRLGLIVTAGITDVADGLLARKKHLATRAGAIVDPLADRAFVFTAMVALTAEGTLALWHLALLVVRDVATALAWVATRLTPMFQRVAFQARPLGKRVTMLQFIALLAAVVRPDVITPLAVLTGAVSVIALGDYARFVWRERERSPA